MPRDYTDFVFSCKNLYLLGIDPIDPRQRRTPEHQQLVDDGIELLKENGIQSFLNLLLHSQYKISKWAAMIALEHGNPDPIEIFTISKTQTIITVCLDEIRRKPIGLTAEQADHYNAWVHKMENHYSRGL